MATHSTIIAWRIPWTEEPVGLQSIELHRVGHDWRQMQIILALSPAKRSWEKSPCVSVLLFIKLGSWSRSVILKMFMQLRACKLSPFSHVLLFATLWTVPARLLCPWDSPGKNTGVGSYSLLQEIFPTQGSNPGLPYCGQIVHRLSHQGIPCFVSFNKFIGLSDLQFPHLQNGLIKVSSSQGHWED